MNRHNDRYRPDIDGMRAIAVLSVVGYHAFPSVLTGGFVGVDVFFVISGFLISQIIIGDLEDGTFSFAGFYRRRIKRIFPALLLVLTAAYSFGWFSLLASEYAQLGKHVAGGAMFVSNLVLWGESGYWDNAALTKPLLHLWSLGVEEQFYILWPLILWFGTKRKLNILAIIALIAYASFEMNIGDAGIHTAADFYSPATRFWELMLGAMLAYTTLHQQYVLDLLPKHLTEVLGLASDLEKRPGPPPLLHIGAAVIGLGLLAIAICALSESRQFPGWLALLPTVGTVLLIAAGQQSWVNRRILSNPILVWFGLISYPLYLWHWPLLSFARILSQGLAPIEVRISLVLIAIILAWVTYELVEKPIRFGKNSVWKPVGLVVPMIVIAGIGIVTFKRDGLPSREVAKINIDPTSGRENSAPHNLKDCDFLKPEERGLFACLVDSRSEPSYAVIGDSKAWAIMAGLARSAPDDRTWLYLGSGKSGPLEPIISQDPAYADYKKKPAEVAIHIIEDMKSVRTVIIATAARALFGISVDDSLEGLPASKLYGAALGGLDTTVTTLIGHGKDVVLLMDNPTLPHMEDCIDRKTGIEFINELTRKPLNPNCRLPIQRHRELTKQYRDMLYEIERRHPGKVRVFDQTDILCDEQSGLCLPVKNGRLVYGIGDHLSPYGSTLVGAQLNLFLTAGSGYQARSQK